MALPLPRPPARAIVHEPGRVVGWDGFYLQRLKHAHLTRAMLIVKPSLRHAVAVELETQMSYDGARQRQVEGMFRGLLRALGGATRYGRLGVERLEPNGPCHALNLRQQLEHSGIWADELPSEAD